MPLVKLFGNLRKLAPSPTLEVPGETVRDVILGLIGGNETLGEAILDGEELRPHVRVMISGVDVELEHGLNTPLGKTDELAIFPPIAGGGSASIQRVVADIDERLRNDKTAPVMRFQIINLIG